MAFIQVSHINKDFYIARNRPGLLGAVKSLFHREYTVKKAVDDISFFIEKGEVVGYIGPNGAGKSTTIKILSGVLTPTSGEARVGGIIPYKERKRNAKRIGVVFGQRSQLYWDLPISDTFELYRKLYEIPKNTYEHNKALFTRMLDLGEFMEQPVRQLSLGQKMKANLALAMLHDPEVLYLDEPTIGLDIMSKKALRQSVRALNQEKGTTVMLTTHDMNDIEAVCGRLILIDHGRKLFDGGLDGFVSQYVDHFTVTLQMKHEPSWVEDSRFSLAARSEGVWTVRATKELTAKQALQCLIERYDPENISVHEQGIEDIVSGIFAKAETSEGSHSNDQ